jgi:hypothetical protein
MKIGREDKWFALYSNGDYKEVLNKDEAIKQKPRFVVKDVYKDVFEGATTWRISDFIFYDLKGAETVIEEGNWSIININESFRRSMMNQTEITIQDPLNEIRCIKLSEVADGYNRFCKIFEAINYLYARASYNSWKEYELSVQNKLLKVQLDRLNQELDSNKK